MVIANADNSSSENTDAQNGCPSLIDLAAYLDKNVSGADTQAVHEHILHCQECEAAVQEIRQFNSEHASSPLVFVPPQVLLAAMNLMNEPQPAWRWISPVRRALALAAAVAICAAGHQIGLALASPSTADDVVDNLNSEMSFGILDGSPDESDLDLDLDLFNLVLSEAS